MGVAAACSLALCSLVNSPGELFTGTAPAAQVVVLSDAERNETYGGTGYAGSEKKERLRDRLRRFFSGAAFRFARLSAAAVLGDGKSAACAAASFPVRTGPNPAAHFRRAA